MKFFVFTPNTQYFSMNHLFCEKHIKYVEFILDGGKMTIAIVPEWRADILAAIVPEWRADQLVAAVPEWRADKLVAIVPEWRADLLVAIVDEWRALLS